MADPLLRRIPPVHQLLTEPPLKLCEAQLGHALVREQTRRYLEKLRYQLRTTGKHDMALDAGTLACQIAAWIQEQGAPRLRPVINATGILLHTGLGRAPLAQEAIEAMVEVAGGYSSLEIDLESGERSQRVLAVQSLLCELTGAEAATVVNNNAAATVVTLAALAAGREVIVSRGELIEIGGSFRLPDVMAQSGALLHEVGTTNKTRLEDYVQAIGPQTAALLKVHTSNYRIVGFTEEVALRELARVAQQHQLPLIHDIGSGALVDWEPFGLRGEPVAARSLADGADLVLFSGDKLLGGPQCGIIVGRQGLVSRIQKHPLSRALRIDKLTLAALHATLRLYQRPDTLAQRLPLLKLVTTPPDVLRERATRLAEQLKNASTVRHAEPVADVSYLGGGSVPGQAIATWCVAIEPRTVSVDQLAKQLRTGQPAVVGRITRQRLLLDLRSVFPDQDQSIVTRFQELNESEP